MKRCELHNTLLQLLFYVGPIAILSLCTPFTINGQSPPVHLHGSISVSSNFNTVSGIEARRPPFGYSISGSPTLTLYGIDLPFSFVFSNYQRAFRQPFNQFGLSPKYKGIQLHLGYRSVNWSRYSMGGHRFLGAGFEGQLGLFRLGYVRGQFLKSVEVDTSSGAQGLYPSYARNGWSAKVGFGKERAYLDIIYFKATDDIQSLKDIPQELYIKPTQNAILGVKGKMGLIKFVDLNVDLGISGLTRDTRARKLPLDSSGAFSIASKILEPNISTQINLAGEASLAFQIQQMGIDLKYKRIDPGYTSQGSYFFRSDIDQRSLGVSLTLLQGKVAFSGRYGLEKDNINRTKTSTTQRKIFSSNVNLRLSRQIGLNVQYSNFGLSQEGTKVRISDTVRLNNITKSLIINPNILFKTGNLQHNLTLVYSDQNLDDKNKFTAQYTFIKTKTYSLNYSLNLGANQLAINSGANYNRSEVSAGNTTSTGILFGISKRVKKKHLSMGLNVNYNQNRFEKEDNGATTRISFNTRWTPQPSHSFRLMIYQMNNTSKNDAVSRSFRELNLRLSYSYRFSTHKNKAK